VFCFDLGSWTILWNRPLNLQSQWILVSGPNDKKKLFSLLCKTKSGKIFGTYRTDFFANGSMLEQEDQMKWLARKAKNKINKVSKIEIE
jgi:hypothetical protein